MAAIVGTWVLSAVALLLGALMIRRKDISRILSIGLTAYVFWWLAVPSLLAPYIAGAGQLDLVKLYVPRSQFLEMFGRQSLLEAAALCGVLYLFLAMPLRSIRPLMTGFGAKLTMRDRVAAWTITIAVPAVLVVDAAIAALTGGSYIKGNAFLVTSTASAIRWVTTWNAIATLIVGFVYACALTDWSRSRYGRRIQLIAWAYIVPTSLLSSLTGARWSILVPLVIALLKWGHLRKQWVRWGLVTAVVIMALVSPVFLSATSELRRQPDTSLSEAVAVGTRVYEQQGGLGRVGVLADQMFTKLDSIGYGSILLWQQGPIPVGLGPTYAAFVSIIPRLLLPGKPVTGSANGDYSGTAPRIVARALGMGASGSVGVSPLAQALWQAGSLGVVLFVLVSLFHLIVLNSLLRSPSLILRGLGVSAIGLPLFVLLIPSVDTAIQTDLRLVAMVLLACVLALAVKGVRSAAH